MNEALQISRLSEVRATPWKNGGGVTRELLAWPSAEDWSIRVSVADIERDGPFSAFPGIERFFAVLEGDGVMLEGVGVIRKGDSPVKFDGEIARGCELLKGRTRDLNVMIRRDRGYGLLEAANTNTFPRIAHQAAVHGVFSLSSGHLVWGEGNEALDIVSESDETLFHVAFWHHAVVFP